MKKSGAYFEAEIEIVDIKYCDIISTSNALDSEGNLSDGLWS